MRGSISWRLHFPGQKTLEEEHADDSEYAESSSMMQAATAQDTERDNVEEEQRRVEAGVSYDNSIYCHSGSHSGDLVWLSDTMAAEMDEAVVEKVRAWKDAFEFEETRCDNKTTSDASAAIDPILEEMQKEQKRESKARSQESLSLACEEITRQYENMVCKSATHEAGDSARDEVLRRPDEEVGIKFGSMFESLEHADATIRLWGAQHAPLRLYTKSKTRMIYVCRSCSPFGRRTMWQKKNDGVSHVEHSSPISEF